MHREDGYTLIEIMFAFSLLAIGMLGIGVGQLSAARMTSVSKNVAQAMNLAEEQIEIFHALAWNPGAPWGANFFTTPVVNQPDPACSPCSGNPFAPLGANNPDQTQYNRSWTLTPAAPPSGLTQITVTVTWINGPSGKQTTTLTTLKGSS